MIWTICFADLDAALRQMGFIAAGSDGAYLLYRKDLVILRLRRPNAAGTLPMAAVEDAFNAADLTPPDLDQTFGD